MFDFIGDLLSAPFICLGWIIIGALAGGLARYFTRSEDEPFIADLLLGLLGALVGGLLAGLIGFAPREGTFGLERVLVNLALSTVGAAILILAFRAVRRA